MQLVTLAEAKERLSIDFDTKDSDITIMANSIEGYLSTSTGLNLKALREEIDKKENPDSASDVNDALLSVAYMAKEYVLYTLYLDYYNAHTEIDDLRQIRLIKSLQVSALVVE